MHTGTGYTGIWSDWSMHFPYPTDLGASTKIGPVWEWGHTIHYGCGDAWEGWSWDLCLMREYSKNSKCHKEWS